MVADIMKTSSNDFTFHSDSHSGKTSATIEPTSLENVYQRKLPAHKSTIKIILLDRQTSLHPYIADSTWYNNFSFDVRQSVAR